MFHRTEKSLFEKYLNFSRSELRAHYIASDRACVLLLLLLDIGYLLFSVEIWIHGQDCMLAIQ